MNQKNWMINIYVKIVFINIYMEFKIIDVILVQHLAILLNEMERVLMLTIKEIRELQNYCDTLSIVNIRDILDQLLYEYKQYIKSGTPEECAQRKEWMQMSYEDIMTNFNSIIGAMRKEVTDMKIETTVAKKFKKRGRPRKLKETTDK